MRVRLRRSSGRAFGALVLGMVLAGCATMPDGGAPAPNSGSQDTDTQANRLVVVAVPPQVGEEPSDLLVGFLDDLVSDEPDYTTAKEYLADPGAWNPGAQVTVLDEIRQDRSSGSLASGRITYSVTGRVDATLDAKQDYLPGSNTTVHEQFSFVKNAKGRWQITGLPQGLIIRALDFQRLYESANIYFPANGSRNSRGVAPLVADPIWVRIRINPLKDAARALVNGFPAPLGAVVTSAFPAGVSVSSVVTSGSTAKVVLRSSNGSLLDNQSTCTEMAAQMYATLSSVPVQPGVQTGQQISTAALYEGSDSTQKCSVGGRNDPYGLEQGPQSIAYFVDASGHLKSLNVGTEQVESVPGVLEPASAAGIGAFAVAPGNTQQVAVVPRDGADLYVGTLAGSASSQHSALHGPPHSISSPSWDETGTLWVVDSDPAAPSEVMALTGGGSTRIPVTVAGLTQNESVAGLRVSEDGSRIALIIDAGNDSKVEVGWVARSGSPSSPTLTVIGLHSVAPWLTSVQSVSWADDDSVIVLGQSNTFAKALSTLEIDGSSALVPAPAAPQATSGMTTVSALQADSDPVKDPLLGDSFGDSTELGKVYVWVSGANPTWKKTPVLGQTSGNGPMPSYPG
jgi:Lipoprotein LpqB beta-propeller domain/Sporulation and spore germination